MATARKQNSVSIIAKGKSLGGFSDIRVLAKGHRESTDVSISGDLRLMSARAYDRSFKDISAFPAFGVRYRVWPPLTSTSPTASANDIRLRHRILWPESSSTKTTT